MIARLRTESPIRFIQTARELLAHTAFYLNRLPKTMRFVWHVPLTDMCRDILSSLVEANSIPVGDMRRGELFSHSLRKLDVLEENLASLAFEGNWFSAIGETAFEGWARLIDAERSLIRGVVRYDAKKMGDR